MVGAAEHGDKAGRLLKHLTQPLTLAGLPALGFDLFGGLHDDGDDRHRLAGFIQDRRIVEVEPDCFWRAAAMQDEFLILVGQGLPSQHHTHHIGVELSDFRPPLAHRAPQNLGMPLPGNDRVAVIVDHDPLGPPERDHRYRRAQHHADAGAQRRAPFRNGAK